VNAIELDVEQDEPWIRAVGAMVAAVIALVVTVVGAWLVKSGWMLGAAGLPGTTVVAWILAPRAVAAGRGNAIGVACELAVLSVVIAYAWISILLTVFAGNEVAWVAWMLVVGAIVFGPLATVIVLPAAFTWTAIVRRVAG
jgi:hypothetical protein